MSGKLFQGLHGDGQDRPEPGTTGDDQAQPQQEDQPRPDASEDKPKLTIEEAEMLFEVAGVPRNQRSIRRYCEQGSLECFKVETQHGQRWMADRSSVEKYILQLQQLQSASQRTTPAKTGESRPAPAMPGHVQPDSQSDGKMMEHLKDQVVFLRGQLEIKDAQLERKDEHIVELTSTISSINQTAMALGGMAQTFQQLLPGVADLKKDVQDVTPKEPVQETGDSEVSSDHSQGV